MPTPRGCRNNIVLLRRDVGIRKGHRGHSLEVGDVCERMICVGGARFGGERQRGNCGGGTTGFEVCSLLQNL